MLTLTKVINACKSARTEKEIANYVLRKTVRDGGVDFLKCEAVSIICLLLVSSPPQGLSNDIVFCHNNLV